MTRKTRRSSLTKSLLPLSLLLAIGLSGCSSIGKGIVEAILEKADEEDTRVCQVFGKPFEGIAPSLEKHQGKTKLLMVHGVGDHLPGYATQFLEKLAKELGVSAKVSTYKNIKLFAILNPDKNLGNLRITRLQSADEKKELWFYELTWSEITRDQKALLSFDNSGAYSYRRAGVNDMLKKFSNDTGPDPIIYLGDSREHILRAFGQAVCWMGKSHWNELPDDKRESCSTEDNFNDEAIKNDNFVYVSHSLGSRITIDGLQRIADVLENPKKYFSQKPELIPSVANARKSFQQKDIQIFMLSNQLPMLQLGRELPLVSGNEADYCHANGTHYGSRLAKQTSLVAFSDPNDILSYAIPHDFGKKYLDARLCAKITNVNINVAKIYDVFDMGGVANPLAAHTGYDTDDRVIAMIAKGIGNKHTAPLIKQRCEWTEMTE
jgi:hypothetical protein